MQITETNGNVSDFCKNYLDSGNGGVMGVPIIFFDKNNPE